MLSGCGLVLDYPAPGRETCDNGVDDDQDGRADCADPDCSGRCPETDDACFDGRDDDGDGLVDWRDPDCWAVATRIEIERCATVSGGNDVFGPNLGSHWWTEVEGAAPVEARLANGGAVLLARDGTGATARSSKVSTGAVAGSFLSVTLACGIHARAASGDS